ncbi:MAG: MnmC family methyltransferase, partial [Bacteroidia bacterium]
LFAQLHHVAWNEAVHITPEFTLRKLHTALEVFEAGSSVYDLIYFDAFAPKVQPELWTVEVFSKLFAASAPGAVLTTYCAKGEVRRSMQAAGFVAERLPGPPGKREMLRGRKAEFSEMPH